MRNLPASFLAKPIAHRGLHDRTRGVIENSPSAFRAAIDGGYGIELDVQLSRDAKAMVFHDDVLNRLTGHDGPVRERDADELAHLTLKGSADVIHDLPAILELIAGKVPLLIEIKDQDGAMGTSVGPLEAAVTEALQGYRGDLALMSFNPHSVAELARLAPDIPRGLVTSSYRPAAWHLPPEICDHLRDIPDYDRVGASFISHQVNDLTRPRVAELKTQGATIFCWTVRSQVEADEALELAQNITFEGFIPS